jgi:hypothetical protein
LFNVNKYDVAFLYTLLNLGKYAICRNGTRFFRWQLSTINFANMWFQVTMHVKLNMLKAGTKEWFNSCTLICFQFSAVIFRDTPISTVSITSTCVWPRSLLESVGMIVYSNSQTSWDTVTPLLDNVTHITATKWFLAACNNSDKFAKICEMSGTTWACSPRSAQCPVPRGPVRSLPFNHIFSSSFSVAAVFFLDWNCNNISFYMAKGRCSGKDSKRILICVWNYQFLLPDPSTLTR